MPNDPPRQVAEEQPAPKQVAQCDDKGVLIALQRSTHAYTIIETNNLRSEDPTYLRWWGRVPGPWGFLEVVFCAAIRV